MRVYYQVVGRATSQKSLQKTRKSKLKNMRAEKSWGFPLSDTYHKPPEGVQRWGFPLSDTYHKPPEGVQIKSLTAAKEASDHAS